MRLFIKIQASDRIIRSFAIDERIRNFAEDKTASTDTRVAFTYTSLHYSLFNKKATLEIPLQWPHVYKCFFHCEILSGAFKENLEISEQDFFNWDALPPLSTHRVTLKKLHRLRALLSNSEATSFD